MSAENALKTLESMQLRVGRINELNDPFEFVPGLKNVGDHTPEHLIQDTQEALLNYYNDNLGIICFSESIEDPVLWSHYANSHKGIALGFDYEMSDNILEVQYCSDRVTADLDKFLNLPENEQLDFVNSVLSIKAPSWSYESEYRVLIPLDECELHSGSYFIKIPENFLYEVILGIRCTVEEKYLKRLFKDNSDVNIKKAKRDILQFKVNI